MQATLIIVLFSVYLALLIALIKFIIRNWRKGFGLKKDHFMVFVGYMISSILLGGAFYFAFSLFYLIGSIFGGITLIKYLLFCFGVPQLLLIPIFGYFFCKDLPKKEEVVDITFIAR